MEQKNYEKLGWSFTNLTNFQLGRCNVLGMVLPTGPP